MPPAIIPIVTALVTAAGVGTSIYSLTNQPSAPKVGPTGPQPLTSGQSNDVKQAVSQQLPNLQSLTGGSLSPETTAVLASLAAGTAGDPRTSGLTQQVINQFFGLGAPGNTGLTSTGTGSTSTPSLSAPSGAPPGLIDKGINDIFQGFGGTANA